MTSAKRWSICHGLKVFMEYIQLPHRKTLSSTHDDVVKWKHFPRHWPFVWGIHRSPVNSPHKGQWRRAVVVFYLCLDKRFSKQSRHLRFETPSHSLWCQCNAVATGNITTQLPPMKWIVWTSTIQLYQTSERTSCWVRIVQDKCLGRSHLAPRYSVASNSKALPVIRVHTS